MEAGRAGPGWAVSRRWSTYGTLAMDALNRRGAALSIRLVRSTRKSPYPVHPKHLLDAPWHCWYLDALDPGDDVLDVGCANGAHTLTAAPRVKRVFGMDRDVGQLALAAATARARGVGNVHLFAWDLAGTFPFPDSMFDAALFLDVIEHLEPRREVLREIGRVLKPEGRLLVSAPNRDTRWRRRLREAGLFAFSDSDHKVEYTHAELLAELRAGGFTPVGPVLPVVYDTPWAGLIDIVGGLSLGLYARLHRWKRAVALRQPQESIGFRVVARRSG